MMQNAAAALAGPTAVLAVAGDDDALRQVDNKIELKALQAQINSYKDTATLAVKRTTMWHPQLRP